MIGKRIEEVTFIRKVSLRQYNTMRIDGVAEIVAFPHSEKGLVDLLQSPEIIGKKVIVIGRGANILLTKVYYNETYLFINLKLMDKIELVNHEINMEAGATLSSLSWFAIENSIKGYEYVEDIPGTLGGAILMNAGTYKDYIGNQVRRVRYYDFKLRKVIERDVTKDDFSKRCSYWKLNKTLVISCKLEVEEGVYEDIFKKMEEVKRNRFMKQPRNYPSAGSVFVRPKKDLKDLVVWELIDKVGLRGFQHGGAKFSDKHPGFIVNVGNATYEDINFLVTHAQKLVQEKFDVELRMEWIKI